jgi:spore coat polysaccharide biosynthesis protein SpsF (cytidylyltransferase family)
MKTKIEPIGEGYSLKIYDEEYEFLIDAWEDLPGIQHIKNKFDAMILQHEINELRKFLSHSDEE